VTLKIIHRPSPNFDERNAPVSLLVLHYTGMKTGAEAIARLCDAEAKVSAHYVVEENGDVYQLVDESKRAWHAGVSFWRGLRNVNANSIGIEIVNPGHEFGYRKFTDAQYKALIELCGGIKKRHNIADVNIVGHSDIAPERKADPGELFDWELLAKNNIGLSSSGYDPKIQGRTSQILDSRIKSKNDSSLVELGYEFHDEGAITAFQRHWRQDKVNGQWDDECGQILANLLETAGR